MFSILPKYQYLSIVETIGKGNQKTVSCQVRELGIIQCLLRKIFGAYRDTHSETIKLALSAKEAPHLGKGVLSLLATKTHAFAMAKNYILSPMAPVINFFKVQGATLLQNKPNFSSKLDKVFSGGIALYHPKPNAAVLGRGKMFGDFYNQQNELLELDHDRVKLIPNTNPVQYQVDNGDPQPTTAEGLQNFLPYRDITFNDRERESYEEGGYTISANGLPVYPYHTLFFPNKNPNTIQNPQNPQLQLGKLGPNHAGDAEIFRFNPLTQALELAVIFRKTEKQWALTGGMRERGEKNLSAARREFKEEAAGDQAHGRLDYLDDDDHWLPPIWHGPNAADFRNTLHGWMETSVNALILPEDQALKWDTLKGGDDADNAQWLSITPEQIEKWASGEDKLFSLHTEFILLTLLNPTFQAAALKGLPNTSHVHLYKVFATAKEQAEKFGITFDPTQASAPSI